MKKNKDFLDMTREELDEWYDEHKIGYGFREYPDNMKLYKEIKYEDIPQHLKARADEVIKKAELEKKKVRRRID